MKKNKVSQTQYRQGDVLIVPVSEIPTGLVKTKKVTLALGEVTGHHHTIFDGAVGYASTDTALAEYFEVKGTKAELTHQEHSTIEIPSGTYRNVRQTEYSPSQLRNVAD